MRHAEPLGLNLVRTRSCSPAAAPLNIASDPENDDGDNSECDSESDVHWHPDVAVRVPVPVSVLVARAPASPPLAGPDTSRPHLASHPAAHNIGATGAVVRVTACACGVPHPAGGLAVLFNLSTFSLGVLRLRVCCLSRSSCATWRRSAWSATSPSRPRPHCSYAYSCI